jgi:hypothetical protein
MTSYTTLVNVDADSAQKLATFIASKLPTEAANKQFLQECMQFIEKASSHDLVNKLLEQNEIILSLEKDEGENLLQLLVINVEILLCFSRG